MSVRKAQLLAWIATLPDDVEIAVDEGGLCLVVEGCDAYYEIGGLPLTEDDES